MTKTTPLWEAEFGPSFQVPNEILAAGLADCSWHNDICPSFALPDDDGELLRLWVDHPDKNEREVPEGARFLIAYEGETLLESDDIGPILAKMLSFKSVEDAEKEAAALRQKRLDDWQPPMSIEAASEHVWSQLDATDIAYAGDPERGKYRGFAALHDRCDANMLLPGAEEFDASNEAQTAWMESIMDHVRDRLIAAWDSK